MIRRHPRSTRTDTLFPSRRSSDLLVGTAYERDVYLLAVIAQELFARDNGAAAFSLPAGIEAVLGKAAAPIPADRFANAVEFADAPGAVIFPPEPVVAQSRLDHYQVSTLPFFRCPPGGDGVIGRTSG